MAPMGWHMSPVCSKVRKIYVCLSPSPEVRARLEAIREPLSPMTILIEEDTMATVARQLDVRDRLIAQPGAKAYQGRPEPAGPLIRCSGESCS
jgi:hypothetical protein